MPQFGQVSYRTFPLLTAMCEAECQSSAKPTTRVVEASRFYVRPLVDLPIQSDDGRPTVFNQSTITLVPSMNESLPSPDDAPSPEPLLTYAEAQQLRDLARANGLDLALINRLIYAYTFAVHHHSAEFAGYLSQATMPLPPALETALPPLNLLESSASEGVDWVALRHLDQT